MGFWQVAFRVLNQIMDSEINCLQVLFSLPIIHFNLFGLSLPSMSNKRLYLAERGFPTLGYLDVEGVGGALGVQG